MDEVFEFSVKDCYLLVLFYVLLLKFSVILSEVGDLVFGCSVKDWYFYVLFYVLLLRIRVVLSVKSMKGTIFRPLLLLLCYYRSLMDWQF